MIGSTAAAHDSGAWLQSHIHDSCLVAPGFHKLPQAWPCKELFQPHALA